MIELIISAILTAIAVVVTLITIPYFLIRRWKKAEYLKQTMREIPCIGGKFCKCYWCEMERIQNETE